MRKPIKSDITDVDYDAWSNTVPYEQSYEKEFDDMVEEYGYDVNDRFTYMAGIRPEDWEQKDTDSAAAFHVDVAGYYVLGDYEGMILVGTLKDIYDYCDNYWGMGLHPDYVCPADSFDYEDGEWVTGGWIDSSRKTIKSETGYDDKDYEYYKKYVQDFDDFEHMKEDLVKERDYFNARKDTPGATKRIRELNAKEKAINEFVNSSRKTIKSGFDLSATEIKDIENQLEEGEDVVELNGWTFVYDYQFDCVIATSPEGKEYDQFRSFTDFLDWYENDYITSSRKPVKSSYNEDDVVFRATTRGGKNFVEVTDTGTDFDRYEIKQNGSVDYANSTAEVLAKLIKQSGWKEGMFDKIEIDNTGTGLGEQYLQIMKMINKEFGSLYKAPNGSAERQYYFDIIRFIAWNIQSHSLMSIEDMIWKVKDALNKKGITCSRKPVKSGFDITPEQNKFNWAYNDWYGHFHMNLDRVPQYLEGVKWCDANKGSEFYDELCEKYNIYPTGDREKAAFYNALKELGEIESVTSSKKRRHKTADERAKDEGADITCSRKSIKSSMDKLDMMCMIEEVCDKLRDNVPNSKIDYNMNDKTNSGWIEVVQENKAMGPGYDTMWTFWVDFDKNTVEMLDPQELNLGTFMNDYDIYTNIKTGLSGGGKRPR